MNVRTHSNLPKGKTDTIITIGVYGDVNRNTITIPQHPIPRASQTYDGNDPTSPENDLLYSRYPEIGGTPLLAKAIHNSTRTLTPNPPQVFTYDPEFLKKNLGCWRELLINLSLYPSKADLAKTVYRIKTGTGWIKDKDAQKNGKNGYLELLGNKNKMKLLDNQDQMAVRRSECTIKVINDRGLYFREAAKEKLESLFPVNDESYYVITLGHPLEQGLYKELSLKKRALTQPIIVLHATSLRREGINIREAASIELTVQSFLYHLDTNPILKELCNCRHLIVRFDDGGVLHYDTSPSGGPTYHYCPFFNTNEMYTPQKYGSMIGYRTILVTAITKGIAWALQNGKEITEGIHDGIRLGVLLGKHHFRDGFANLNNCNLAENTLKKLFENFADNQPSTRKQIDMEVQNTTIQDFAKRREFSVASLKLPRTQHELKNWSRIYSFRDYHEDKQSQFEIAVRKIVQHGLDKVVFERGDASDKDKTWLPIPIVLCPYMELGGIKTSDRNEIDSLIWLSAIIRKYLEDDRWRKPLSIATFGPPGSGKNFTIKQILESVSPSASNNTLEYNVAQFTSVNNLTTAFHQAQDKALSEKVPLIIFDEFDATFNNEPLGWLKYFLAPMQDGVFNGEHGTYQVGKAIFVFAGGTSHTFEQFCDKPPNPESFKSAKGPDFISRLRGYLNIGDINALESDSTVNDLLMYRRAIILRSILEKKATGIFDRDTGEVRISNSLVRAFLKVPKYKHGVRSMEAIVEMAILAREGFVAASLPPRDQLEMHVNADEFLGLVGDLTTQNQLERQVNADEPLERDSATQRNGD